MTEKDREILLYCLNEMMEGHFRIMRALHLLQETVNTPPKSHDTPQQTCQN
ncbi:MAG: hypothetical protein KDJ35_07755 [Alphaproteobacteria bacterium]|nr:hypothetical protein [Alphaproteobacteria bacterium]